MKMKCILCAVAALAMCSTSLSAAPAEEKEKVEFKRHWFMQVQAGAAYTLGEIGFGKLVSPAAALYAGHQFSPLWGLRFGLSGWQSKGAWVSPESVYQYKYLQGNVDVTLDLANLFGKFNYRRTVNPYLFAGVGVNGAFDNDEANALNDQGYTLQHVWSDSKVFAAGRMGLGVNFRFSDCVLFGVELNANMLSDKYNSKKAGNLDWQFNALAGFTFRFGKNYSKSQPAVAAAPVTPARTTEPAEKEEPAVQESAPVQTPETKSTEKSATLCENIFFRIGSAQIHSSEQVKIAALAEFLKANSDARVEIIGYADAATGSKAFNLKLSKLRAASVAEALEKAGVDAGRIAVEGKGDTVQPFSGVEQNRVCICVAR